MNNEFQRSDNNNGNTVKTVVITVLVMIVLGLVAFLVWDKVISKDSDKTNNENNNQNNSNNTSEVVTLDINSSTVKNLTSLVSNQATDSVSTPAFSSALFKALDLSNSSRYDSMLEVASVLVSKSSNMEFYVDAKTIESKFKEVFGQSVTYTNKSFESSCGVASDYDKSKNRYKGTNGCGGDESGAVLELYKAEQKEDEIYTYWYAYVISLKPMLINDNYDFVYVVESPFGLGKGYTSSSFADVEEARKEADKLKTEGKLDTYKITYKKQSDGNYYVYSGEWM